MFNDLRRGRRLVEDVHHLLGQWIATRAIRGDRFLDVVLGSAQSHIRAEEPPVCAWTSLIRHSDASRIYRADAGNLPIELNMRMRGDQNTPREVARHRADACFWSRRRYELLIASR